MRATATPSQGRCCEQVRQDCIIGGTVGYGRSDFENKSLLMDDTDIDFYSTQLYAVARRLGWRLSVLGGYTRSRYDADWLVVTALSGIRDTAKYHADTWTVGGAIGYDLHILTTLTVTPTVGLFHVRTTSGRITTRHLAVNNRVRERLTRVPAEVRLALTLPRNGQGTFTLNGLVGYAYDVHADGTEARFTLRNIPSFSPITARRRVDSRHSYRVGGGVSYAVSQYSLGLDYQYRGRPDYDSHTVTGTLSLGF